MPEDTNELERRFARLEMLVATLVAHETFAEHPDEIERFISLLRETKGKDESIFWEYFFKRTRFWGYPRGYRDLTKLVQGFESRFEETASLTKETRAELEDFIQRFEDLTKSTSGFQQEIGF